MKRKIETMAALFVLALLTTAAHAQTSADAAAGGNCNDANYRANNPDECAGVVADNTGY